MGDEWETPQWVIDKEKRVEAATGPFEAVRHLLHVDIGDLWRGPRLPVYERLRKDEALRAVYRWKPEHIDQAIALVVGTFANEIAAAAGGQDPATIAWVLARMCNPLPAAREKLTDALAAVREWRDANNQRDQDMDQYGLAIRIPAETLAGELAATAGDQQDPATLAWVLAGLRCTRRPFCLACDSCFTIDAPHRHDAQLGTGVGRG